MAGENAKASAELKAANAKAAENPEAEEELIDDDSLMGQIQEWIRTQAPWWATSFTIHMVALSTLLLLGNLIVPNQHEDAPAFEAADTQMNEAPAEHYDLGDPQVDPSELSTESLMEMQAATPTVTEQYNDDSATFTERGGGVATTTTQPDVGGKGGPDLKAFGPGPRLKGGGGIGAGIGTGTNAGSGGDGNGFGGRGTGSRKAMLGRYGGTKATERAVGAALYWLAHHQMREGNWSLMQYQKMCKDKTCTGPASQESLSAATALGLLPFLAAGQTHTSPGPFQKTVFGGVYWLMNHQKPDGDLSAGAESQMYSHGLASIALCEAYGMSKDKTVGAAAQKAINFIQAAQNSKSGGWRYHPGEEGDTSVVGWQLMSLKSAMMAGLTVNPATLDGTKKWLLAASKGAGAGGSSGAGGGQFSYQPDGAPTPTMSAVGLLCSQYLHAGRADPVIVGGVQYLMANQPDQNARSFYYWYYATQVLHNMADKDWDTWNHKMRDILVHEQAREGCAAGSWDPDKPVRDAWGPNGGRIMMTSLGALTLEVYYRYLPLYKLDKPDEIKPGAPLDGGAKPAPAMKPAMKPAAK
jgi:hypothetical protein